MKLAIVGSRSLAGSYPAAHAILDVLEKYRPKLVISGGAEGIDQMAMQIAEAMGIPVKVFLPYVAGPPNQALTWEKSYKPRNLKIAEACDRLVRIAALEARSYGSGWTRDQAEEMGKPTEEIVIP